MGLLKFTGGIAKSVVDVKGWTGYDLIKDHSKILLSSIKRGFRPLKATYKETFAQSMARQNFNDKDLQRVIHRYRQHIFIFSFFAACGALYMLYLFWERHLFPGIITLFLTLLFVIRAFAAHFYIFQVKNRKLGCTLKEYLDGKIKQEKSS